jgi:hypothetical protein
MISVKLIAAMVTAAVLLVLTGCGPDQTAPTSKLGTVTPAPTSAQADEATAPALAAYHGMWDAFVEAGKTSDPDADALRRYASGDALSLIVSSLYLDRSQGKVSLGAVGLRPRVVDATPADDPITVTVEDCVDTRQWLVYWADGGLVNDKPGGLHANRATVTRTADQVWTVSVFQLRAAGTC